MLDERPVLRALVAEPAPQPGPGRPPGEAHDERGEHGVAGRAGDLLVEGQVRVDEPVVVERELDQGARRLVERGAQAGERGVVDVQGGEPGGLGLEEAPDGVEGATASSWSSATKPTGASSSAGSRVVT